MAVVSRKIPNLIQGTTQQAPQQRRDTQCEEQVDCFNSTVDGCIARPSGVLKKWLAATNLTGAYFYDIQRSKTEHYLVVEKGGAVSIYDLEDLTACTITYRSWVLTVSANPGNNETVTINGKVYTFQTSLSNVDGHVKVGATAALSLANLANAITLAGGTAGTDYATATTALSGIAAWSTATNLYVNSTASTDFVVAETLANGSWAADLTYIGATTPADNLVAATINDSTFIGNKTVKPAMRSTLSPARPPEALVYFRAGMYSTTYQLSLTLSGTRYDWRYKTPDNSDAANSDYIATNQLAATFYRALTGSAAPVNVSGHSDDGFGVQAPGSGDGGGSGAGTPSEVYAPIHATNHGFSVQITGNVLRIYRSGGTDFDISVSDGAGGDQLKAIKGSTEAFGDLPRRAFDGFTVKVRGNNQQAEDDYYVEYQASSGTWQEVVAPATPYQIDPLTMPYRLINTGYRTFTFGQAVWGERISGDGANTAKDPSFIGRYIQDLAFDNQRFAVVLEGSTVWSRNRNAFVFFPDTVQTILDTDPVDSDVTGTRQVSLLRRMVHHDEGTFLWADQAQHRVSSGVDPFRQSSLQIKPSTAYEFADTTFPMTLGTSLYFVTENGGYATIRDLTVTEGKPRGDTDVTSHVPRFIPAGTRWITGSDAAKCFFVTTDNATSYLYVYNFLIEDQQRLQSAWNLWRMPDGAVILWAGVYRQTLKVLLQKGTGVALLHFDLRRGSVDSDSGATYFTRLDFRITEAGVSGMSYSGVTGLTTITLPFALATAETSAFMVVERSGDNRGKVYPTSSVSGVTVKVEGDCSAASLYLGYRISAERLESEFYLRQQDGTIILDRLQIMETHLSLSKTGYTRAVVTVPYRSTPFEYETRKDDAADSFVGVTLDNTKLRIPVNSENTQATVRLINDSFMPSAWQTIEWYYQATYRPTPEKAAAQQGA